ncbi:MAG: MotA/TolQ/ExbB proton channel family protein [Candidatus Omnitrophica bacterium]|nr:MotA/TolQ/ExbB proton channel family protein [Candidatus Omnitrophota bacterium]
MFKLFSDAIGFIVKGGWVMVPLGICSLIALTIIIERTFFYLSLKKFKKLDLRKKIFDLVRQDKIKEALEICDKHPYHLTNILKAGILHYNDSKEVIQEAMENASFYELPILESHLNFLSTLAHVSPLLGLLGTVLGLVKCFYFIEQKTKDFSMVNPSDIAGGIWEALLTTVAGLCIAIPSYLAYNFFVHKVNSYILETERASTELLEILLSNRK